MQLAADMGISVEQRQILLTELADMTECGACGTASVISPISRVIDPDFSKIYEFGDNPGTVSTKLYKALLDVQYGRVEDKYDWCKVL